MAKSNGAFPDLGLNYRKDSPPAATQGHDIIVDTGDPDLVNFDQKTNTTQIDLPDGTVSITLGPPQPQSKGSKDFHDNLAEALSEAQLSVIAEKLMMGIESDISSRSSWLENVSNAISLLGLEIKQPRGASVSGATPSEATSTVDHPLLLEAVLRFQANARGELLPTDGPVKVSNDGTSNALSEKLAQALEKDLNHYLTKVASEYYPDTDRMLLMLGFSGISFKKGYHDPIKRRPVIASIDAKDLIVSNAETNLDGAGRVTHAVKMRPSTIKRMQLVGAYRDIALPANTLPTVQNPIDAKVDQIQGIAPPTYIDQDDRDRELYECYCEVEIPGYEHEFDGKMTGLPLPYKVVIDKESRRILEIRRNWEEDDPLCMARNRIIAYIFIPGLGFYGIGLVNILGNATKAVTAAWRLMLDAGMFACFPGFLYVKTLQKQLTNQFRVPPGGGMAVDTVGGDIRASIMPLPYKDPSAVFIQLIDNISQTAQRVGGTTEMQVGEGKQDAPVGTTLAMIEQATKLISAVHKRLHQAQGQEFEMLKSLLSEDPEALWRHNKKSAVLQVLGQEAGMGPITQQLEQAESQHRQLFLAALADADLEPRADPNTSSQTERYLKVVAMRQMCITNPGLDINAIDQYALETMGVDDPERFFKPPAPQGAMPPDPKAISAQAAVLGAQARMADTQTKSQKTQADIQLDQATLDAKNREVDAREKIASLGVARAMVVHRDQHELATQQNQQDNFHKTADRQVDVQQHAADQQHDMNQQANDQQHAVGLANINNNANNTQAMGLAQMDNINQTAQRQHEAALDARAQSQELGLAAHEAQQEHTIQGQQHAHEQGLASQEQSHQAAEGVKERQHKVQVEKHKATQAKAQAKAQAKNKPAAKKKAGS